MTTITAVYSLFYIKFSALYSSVYYSTLTDIIFLLAITISLSLKNTVITESNYTWKILIPFYANTQLGDQTEWNDTDDGHDNAII